MKETTLKRILEYTTERDGDQFHSPANLEKSLVIDAAELLESFQWDDENYDIDAVKE